MTHNSWFDPFYLEDHLKDEELAIQKNMLNLQCKKALNLQCIFSKKYKKLKNLRCIFL